MLSVQGGGQWVGLPALTPTDLFTDIKHRPHSNPDIPLSELVFGTDMSGPKCIRVKPQNVLQSITEGEECLGHWGYGQTGETFSELRRDMLMQIQVEI